jgi:putative FmdB family regulatory protein
MPTYEYRCTACEKEIEVQQRMSDPALTVCETCGGPLERLISRTAFHLKGGGWYKDLYASTKPGAGEGAASGGSTSPATTSTESSTSDAKPAASSSDSGSSTATGTPSGGTSTPSGST